ncbi:hypothetical protein M087_1722 [Bacteroides fragilis str. S23 R14]|nr:hypothetical protein M087_1722 [Bacteroides fragilis str. S23 R14]EYA65717.1 hypothetical protein M139_3170 [Bacteroides fragilis str. S23L24]
MKLYMKRYNISEIIYIFAAKEYLCWRRDKLLSGDTEYLIF